MASGERSFSGHTVWSLSPIRCVVRRRTVYSSFLPQKVWEDNHFTCVPRFTWGTVGAVVLDPFRFSSVLSTNSCKSGLSSAEVHDTGKLYDRFQGFVI